MMPIARCAEVTREVWEDKFGEWYIPEPNTGCWLWTMSLSRGGYGQKWTDTKNPPAHRLAWELLRGPIPKGMQIDHLCRNRSCVNPDHLEVVTQRENIVRGVGWAGLHAQKTLCPKGHPYGGCNLRIDARGRRECFICRNTYHQRHREHRNELQRIRRAKKKGLANG